MNQIIYIYIYMRDRETQLCIICFYKSLILFSLGWVSHINFSTSHAHKKHVASIPQLSSLRISSSHFFITLLHKALQISSSSLWSRQHSFSLPLATDRVLQGGPPTHLFFPLYSCFILRAACFLYFPSQASLVIRV